MKKLFSIFLALVMVISVMATLGVPSVSAERTVVSNIDFSEDYYSDNTYVTTYGGAHGNAMKFTRVSISTANWGNAQIWKLGDDGGALELPVGATLDVSLELIKNKLTPATSGGTDYRDFSIGILYLNDTEASNVTGAQSKYNLGYYSSRIMKIADVKGTISTDWETVTGTIKVPNYAKDAKAYIVLCGNGYQTGFSSEIWVDNLVFAQSLTTIINFSEDFYTDNSNSNASVYNGARGNVLYFKRISISTDNWGNAHIWALGDNNGALKLTSGATYDVSLELIKKTITPDSAGNYRDFSVGILYLNDTEAASVRGGQSTTNLGYYSSRIMKIADVDGAMTTEWETVSGTIAVPEYAEDAKAYMVLCGDGYQSGQNEEVSIDNIVIAPSSKVKIDIDFSEEYYADNNYVKQYNTAHGKALNFNRVSITTENWGKAVIHAIGDDDGELNLPVGEELNVSFDIIKNKLHPATTDGTDYRDFSVGIVYLNDTEVTNVLEAKNNGLMNYASRIIKLADIEGTISTDWETVTGTITVPEYALDAKAYMVLYGDYQTSFTLTEIWIDNLKIETPSEITVGDFTGDGEVDATDIIYMRKVLLGIIDEYDVVVADVNDDGYVNILDLVALKKLTVKS